jgi:hypothetical protein
VLDGDWRVRYKTYIHKHINSQSPCDCTDAHVVKYLRWGGRRRLLVVSIHLKRREVKKKAYRQSEGALLVVGGKSCCLRWEMQYVRIGGYSENWEVKMAWMSKEKKVELIWMVRNKFFMVFRSKRLCGLFIDRERKVDGY